MLNEENTFEKLGNVEQHKKTAKIVQKLKNWLLELVKKKLLTPENNDRILPTGLKPQWMYGLPKTKKLNVPLRPILSMVGSAQYELVWLSEILAPVQLYSKNCISDSFSFANVILQLGPAYSFICSFDISSLFTDIPLDQTMEIC